MDRRLGARIRQARKAANLSQSQLAAKIGAHVTSVSDWERNRNAPSARHLLSIAQATGHSIEHFTEEGEDDEEAADRSSFDELLRRRVRVLLRQELELRHIG
jgi:transcriptional regulator with XRE-family HTH domain